MFRSEKMKLFSTVFPKDDAISVLNTLSTNCTIEIQKASSNLNNDIPFVSESQMLQELLSNLQEIEDELNASNCSLNLPSITEDQTKFLAKNTKKAIIETSLTRFLQEKKNQISRILEKIKNDSGVVSKLMKKIRKQLEFISLMQSIYTEFNHQNSLFSEGAPESNLRNSIRGIFYTIL